MDDPQVTRDGISPNKLANLDAGVRQGLGLAAGFLVNQVHAVFDIASPRGRASGRLVRSIGVSPIVLVDGYWKCRIGPSVLYGYWVHQGTGSAAGKGKRKQPPIDEILQWIKEKGITPSFTKTVGNTVRTTKVAKKSKNIERDMRTLAFLIARKIGRDGTLPFPYLSTALVASRYSMINFISSAMVYSLRG